MGFFWWEVDLTYYVLKLLSLLGLIWDLKQPPQRVLDAGRAMTGGSGREARSSSRS
jgi:stearoyl-CoA desaturase (Delta-9 desaturase)